MNKLTSSEAAFLTDLAQIKRHWVSVARARIDSGDLESSEQPEAWSHLRSVFDTESKRHNFALCMADILGGAIHSMLVSLDGGTALAETTLLNVVDSNGEEFRKYLHEFWPEYGGNAI